MQPALYTIGHSNLDTESFIKLLHARNIQVVVDVRSAPYSRYVPHFNRREIEAALTRAGLKYLFMGDVIGGKPTGNEYLDENGRVMYDRLAAGKTFQSGLDRLIKGMDSGWSIVLMCAELDPFKCHRHHLLARELEIRRSIPVWHIQGDGTLTRAKGHLDPQLPLF